ncbi:MULTISPECIES: LysR family transcriptional regulator [Burkholderia]|nr:MULTISPECIES: LysR family transcriptional regulator [Burkholderia]NIF70324.1 LysR family transcriptional regulator [Burkholderia sp. Ap-962]MBJ9679233.1 LysR family transcriptional regulator [Burkholderia gladioli]MBU9173628.1 LysR family transcriptional regulator [Burkholderia gladioli]MBU9191340.1 LysR family transcriptional regulator [Burkholderia gladioli]MBU9323229.1 LysR family transcriptional regulator [Burkholderia gladioli]
MRREDLADLMAFAVIAEEGSFTRAAVRLGLSSSALSHAIRLLEQRLGVRLLNRTTRSVAPTSAGQRLLVQLKPSLAQIEDGLACLAEEREDPSGVVRINTHRSAALLHVLPALAELGASFPNLVLDITVDDSDVDIVAKGFDAGIRHGEHVARDMVAVRISPEFRTAVVATPGYLERTPRIRLPSDLQQHRCLVWRYPTSGELLKWEFQKNGRRHRVVVEPSFITNDIDVLIKAALTGSGLAYLLKEQVADQLAEGSLVEVLEPWHVLHEACYLYYPNRRQLRPVLRVLIDAIRFDN